MWSLGRIQLVLEFDVGCPDDDNSIMLLGLDEVEAVDFRFYVVLASLAANLIYLKASLCGI